MPLMRAALLIGYAMLGLAACNKISRLDCSNDNSKSVIASQASDKIQKATKSALGSPADPSVSSESKIRATIALLKITLEDIRTTKTDPNSTKRYCEGTLKAVVPLGILNDADQTRQTAAISSVASLFQAAGIERSADTLTHQVSYTVQPTDDRKKVFGEIEDFGDLFSTFGEVVASHLLLPKIQANQLAAAAQASSDQQEQAQQAAAASEADLEMATAENRIANQTIAEVWKALPDVTRVQNLDLQRAWIKKKTADCNIKAAETSVDPIVKEAARLRCDTETTRNRSAELQQLLNR